MQFDFASKPRRNTSYMIYMENRYPFDHNANGATDCIVKMKVNSSKDTFQDKKKLIDKYSSLKHEALVEIINVFESKEGWEIYYEFVPISLKNKLRNISEQQTIRAKKILLNVAEYLLMKEIRPVFNQYNVGFVNNFPKYFLSFHSIKELESQHKFNEILLQLELELETLFKLFITKYEIQTMDQLPSIIKPQLTKVEIIDKKIAQIRRKMSDNNLSLQTDVALAIKEIVDQSRQTKSPAKRKTCLKDFIKSPEPKTRISLEKHYNYRSPQHTNQNSIIPTLPSHATTKIALKQIQKDNFQLLSPKREMHQRFSQFQPKPILNTTTKKRKTSMALDLKIKQSLLKTQQALYYYERKQQEK